MGRLHCVVLLTPDVERQRAFYADRLGLHPSRTEPAMTAFAMRGASLVLQPQPAGQAPELRISLTTSPLEPLIASLRAKSARLEGDITETALHRMALVRDPEDNVVQLVEPRQTPGDGVWPRLSHVIVSATKFEETVAFYRELLGLKLAEELDHWVEFNTGDTRLAVHDRDDADALPLHPDQRLAFALEDEDFDAWIDELRLRQVPFAAAPAEGDFGPQAEVEDGDGWLVVLRGPRPAESLDEDELDAVYGDEDDEPHDLPRRGGELGQDVARRPSYNPAKAARKQAARVGKTAPEPERGGFVTRPGTGGPRPFPPRPSGPRPYAPRPDAPRPPRPGGPPRQGPGRSE